MHKIAISFLFKLETNEFVCLNRSVMPKKKSSKKRTQTATNNESDSAYFLKIILYFILGTFWMRLLNVDVGSFRDISLPLGLIVGVVFASREQFQIDRKIEYAILLGATILSFYLPVGLRI